MVYYREATDIKTIHYRWKPGFILHNFLKTLRDIVLTTQMLFRHFALDD